MTARVPILNGDPEHDFLVGTAVIVTLIAAIVVGLELRGAAAGDPIDTSWVAIAVLIMVTTIGGVLLRRRAR